MNDQRQVGGSHYRTMEIQPWDAMKAWMSPAEFRGFLLGNVIKYAARCHAKGSPVEDLRKARHYLDKLIEEELAAPAQAQHAVSSDPIRRALEDALNRDATRRSRGFHPQEVPTDGA